MRLAVPVSKGRVSSLFDVARWLMVVDVIGGEATFTKVFPMNGPNRQRAISELGVDVLICGAISRDLEESLVASGVEVVAEIRGGTDDVLRAYTNGSLIQPRFMMPGCHGRRRQARNQMGRPESVDASARRSAERVTGTPAGGFDDEGPTGWMVH